MKRANLGMSSVAGLPNSQALTGAGPSTVYGLLVAQQLGVLSRYRTKVLEYAPKLTPRSAVVRLTNPSRRQRIRGIPALNMIEGLEDCLAWRNCKGSPTRRGQLLRIENTLLRMIALELFARTGRDAAAHSLAIDLAEAFSRQRSFELVAAAAWVERRDLTIRESSMQSQVGFLCREAILNYPLESVASLPPLVI